MGVDEELAAGVCIGCLLNHVRQIVMSLFIISINAMQSNLS